MKRIILVLLLAIAAGAPAHAAVDIFLEIQHIEGESQDAEFQNQIDVVSWNQSVANVNNMPVVLPLVFTHAVDKATPKLIEAALMGTDLQEAILRVRSVGGNQVVFLTIILNNPRVVSVKNGGSESDGSLTEIVTLTCATFEYKYLPVDENGQQQGEVRVNGSCGN